MRKDIVIRKYTPELIKRIAKRFIFPPSRISKNFVQIDEAGLRSIEKSIRKNYHTGWRSENNYSRSKYRNDLNAHLFGRLESARQEIIPWLDNAATLQNKRILEIGCGTGSSTIALAEQGTKVTGIDVDEGALLVAKERATVYGVDAGFMALNARDVSIAFHVAEFDIVIFFACLEHMTIEERLSSMEAGWKILPADGLLVVVETPNRLWYFDDHTSWLPFFHWLPNELAFAYSKFSSRENFRESYRDYTAASKEHFLRRGRGVSFHEFDIAVGRVEGLNVISSMSTFRGIRHRMKKSRLDREYKSLLMSVYPNVHEGFFDDYLYLIIKKG